MKCAVNRAFFSVGAWAFVWIFSAFAFSSADAATQTIALDGTWQIRTDSENTGKSSEWFARPLSDSGKVDAIPVPGVLQQIYPEYHGLVWYERPFATPANPNPGGKTFLRFYQAEYRADVWLNGHYLGFHEGGEASFELDATDALCAVGEENRLTVRVLNASDTPIDGISMANIPRRNNTNTITPGCGYASGGLVDSVELLLVPAVRIADLHLIPDWKTGEIRARLTMQNFTGQKAAGEISLRAASIDGGEFTPDASFLAAVGPGESMVEGKITVPDFKLWNLNDPNLYQVSAEWSERIDSQSGDAAEKTPTLDRRTATCGFRDFRFENGAFRLNGKRIYVKCSHSGSDSPITHRVPLDPDLFRKDILICKMMGFNMIRYIAGMPRRFQLDLCDRVGFLVYDECLAGWCFGPCPERSERFTAQTEGMILRDRNHPSVVIWGLLNETADVELVLESAAFLKRLRQLDPDRMVFLNSGSFDSFASEEVKTADYALWHRKNAPITPAAIKNETDQSFFFDGTEWTAETFFLHPGDAQNEYAALKWTAPAEGEYQIDAHFTDVVKHGQATVDLYFFHEETPIWSGYLNLHGAGKQNAFSGKVSFKKGEELTLVVGVGDDAGFGDTTAMALEITGPDGTVFDVNRDFSTENNPNGVWCYGYLPAGEKLQVASFALFDIGSFAPFDLGQKKLAFEPIGRFANPGSDEWQNELGDTHPYKPVPHTASVIQELRTHSKGNLPVFLSEYGIGSGVDLFRLTRYFEQHNATASADAIHYRVRLENFMTDWNRWKLDETFASPEDFFQQAIRRMAEQRRLGINAIRANANVIAHSVTGTHDQGISGEGLTTCWREFKPGTVDAMADVFAPLRFCNFVEPLQLYRGDTAKIEAVLVNEDVLPPGDYPVRYIVVGPKNERIFDEVRTLTIPAPPAGGENPMVLPAFSEEITIDGPVGEYRFIAEFQERAAASGGLERFFVSDRSDLPKVDGRFIVWGNDAGLLTRLKSLGVDAVPFVRADGSQEELTPEAKIVVGWKVDLDRDAEFPKLYDAVRSGADLLAVAAYDSFRNGDDRTFYLPFESKGSFATLPNWLYHKDDWAANDPAFERLDAGNVLDYVFWRELIPYWTFNGQPDPDAALAGAFNTQMGYSAGLSLAVWKLGDGTITLNTFGIMGTPNHPVSDRMLLNLLRRL